MGVDEGPGLEENQKVVFPSDAGEDIRQVLEYQHPYCEHITMRLTVLPQQARALEGQQPKSGAAAS